MTKKQLHLVIVTGMSGAGKTVAIQSFEDLGYFTIDNMPPALLPKFLQLVETKEDDHKLALVVDMRSRSFFSEIQAVLDELENQDDLDFKILFLDAADKELVARYKLEKRVYICFSIRSRMAHATPSTPNGMLPYQSLLIL